MPASSTKSNRVDVPCAFCGGSGLDPFGIMSWLSKCCVCGGEGVVKVFAPYVPCAHCRGSGAVKTLTCTVCGGKGVVTLPDVPVDVCPECRGTGDDASASAMDCLKCHGRGFVPQMTKNVKITQMS
jgi:DnaJ-class molecular chaperone